MAKTQIAAIFLESLKRNFKLECQWRTTVNNDKTTALLMAATHVYRSELEKDIDERLIHPYKTPIDETTVDIQKVKAELNRGKSHYAFRNLVNFLILSYMAFMLFTSPEYKYPDILTGTFFAVLAVEFISRQLSKHRIRQIISEVWSTPNEDQAPPKTSYPRVAVSGGFSPFIGAGVDLDSWSFPINLELAAEESKSVENVEPADMHKWIVNHLRNLGIDEMEIEEQLFVNGRDVNSIDELLPEGRLNMPKTDVSDDTLQAKMFGNDKLMRHYTAVRIPIYDKQVMISMFFRLLKINETLFVESRFFLLRPLMKKYRDLAQTPKHFKFRDLMADVLISAVTAPFKSVYGIFETISSVSNAIAGNRRLLKEWRNEVEDNRLYNYGWEYSLREKWMSSSFERYFQQIDQDLFLKLLTDEFLNSILSYLEQKNISTERFKQTTTKIINEGVMISGGEVKTESFAVGKGANIVKTTANKITGDKAA